MSVLECIKEKGDYTAEALARRLDQSVERVEEELHHYERLGYIKRHKHTPTCRGGCGNCKHCKNHISHGEHITWEAVS